MRSVPLIVVMYDSHLDFIIRWALYVHIYFLHPIWKNIKNKFDHLSIQFFVVLQYLRTSL